MYTGPHIIKDGLVFGYDTGYGVADNDTGTRFYAGEPTNNFMPTLYIAGSNVTSGTDEIGDYKEGTITRIGCPNGTSINSGSTYTFTIELRSSQAFNMSADSNQYAPQNSGNDANRLSVSYIRPNYTAVNDWVTYSTTVVMKSGLTNPTMFDFFIPVSFTGRLYYRNAQLEYNAQRTPFVNGTRSSTASLIDLKGTTDIDVSNASFDSTGQPDFDGTNDYLDLGSDVTFKGNGGDWSAEHIVKYDVVPAGYNNSTSPGNFLGGTVNYNSWYWSVLNRKLALWNRSPGVWKYGSTTLEANKFYHVVLVCEPGGTSYKMYLNGVEEGGTNASYVYNASHSGISARYFGVGYAPSTRVVNGKIPVTRIYEKALSATEIKQNFNAYKKRFDI